MHGVAHALGTAHLPLVIHPEGWTRRRLSIPGREPLEIPTPSRQALEGAGFDIVEDREPSLLLDGALLMTGEVERTTEFERGFPGHEACRNGRWEPDPLVRDDQALVARIRGKGLVILTGCGHSGIVNVVRHVRRVAAGEPIHAIVGGFHLTGPAFEPIIEPTVDALAELGADYLVPTHCTGFRAVHALADRFGDAFVLNSVGTRLEFAAAGGAGGSPNSRGSGPQTISRVPANQEYPRQGGLFQAPGCPHNRPPQATTGATQWASSSM
jgi:7,8-dihydropterin-6-yl-methyl-4-(beta-D-ribofuranosyl)aminobenzene 5'-phosphate synthase